MSTDPTNQTTEEPTSPGELMVMLLMDKDKQIDRLRTEAALWRIEAIKLGHSGHLS